MTAYYCSASSCVAGAQHSIGETEFIADESVYSSGNFEHACGCFCNFRCVMRIALLPALITATFAAGCAWTMATPIDPKTEPFWGGFVYYECKPLVALTGSQITVVYVKNPSKAYAVRFGAFLAKNDVKLTFDRDCGVPKVESNLDTTAVLQLLESALDKVAPDLKPVSGTASNAKATQLYEVIFDDEGNIVRLRPLIRPNSYVDIPAGDG